MRCKRIVMAAALLALLLAEPGAARPELRHVGELWPIADLLAWCDVTGEDEQVRFEQEAVVGGMVVRFYDRYDAVWQWFRFRDDGDRGLELAAIGQRTLEGVFFEVTLDEPIPFTPRFVLLKGNRARGKGKSSGDLAILDGPLGSPTAFSRAKASLKSVLRPEWGVYPGDPDLATASLAYTLKVKGKAKGQKVKVKHRQWLELLADLGVLTFRDEDRIDIEMVVRAKPGK